MQELTQNMEEHNNKMKDLILTYMKDDFLEVKQIIDDVDLSNITKDWIVDILDKDLDLYFNHIYNIIKSENNRYIDIWSCLRSTVEYIETIDNKEEIISILKSFLDNKKNIFN